MTSKSSLAVTWDSIAAEAGRPVRRFYESWDDGGQRLFGKRRAALRLWHDAAMWHPFANQVWFILEASRIPYERQVVPLSSYLKDPPSASDVRRVQFFRDHLGQRSIDSVPYVQEATINGWSEPWQQKTAVEIVKALHKKFPDSTLLPRTPGRRRLAETLLAKYKALQAAAYGAMQSGGSKQQHQHYVSAMNEWAALFGNAATAMNDDGDGDTTAFGGPISAGPFLFGELPCAVDVLLLPLLERCEANVVHPVIGQAPHLALDGWPELAGVLAGARALNSERFPFVQLLSDATSVAGVRLAVTGAVSLARMPEPPRGGVHAAAAAAAAHAPADCAEAAARLASGGRAVAAFACDGAGTGRPRGRGQCARPRAGGAEAAVVEALLQGVARTLLVAAAGGTAAGDVGAALASAAQAHAAAAAGACGRGGLAEVRPMEQAAEALVFLAENTGVPRDMARRPAAALRAHLLLLSAAAWDTRTNGTDADP